MWSRAESTVVTATPQEGYGQSRLAHFTWPLSLFHAWTHQKH